MAKEMPSVELPPRLPLVITIQNRDTTFDRDSRLVNCIAEMEPISQEYWIESRIGLETHETYSGNGHGIYNWRGDVYTVFGTTLRKNGVSLGTVDDTNGVYAFQELLGNGWLVLNNGVKAYYTDGTTVMEIPPFDVVHSGAFVVDTVYRIVEVGDTDWLAIGAPGDLDSPTPPVGAIFTATGPGDPFATGTAVVVATFLIVGVTYEIYDTADGNGPFPDSWEWVPPVEEEFVIWPGYWQPGAPLTVTDFTAVGAADNTVGTVFTATGVGTGSGTVRLPNFPPSHVKGWAYLDGTLYVMDAAAKIYGTSTLSYGGIGGFDDPRIWDPLNVIVARMEPGDGVALAKHLGYIIAFKTNSAEAFYNAQNVAGSPLRSVQGAYAVFGCWAADSIQEIDGTLVWLTRNRAMSPQVARMDDLRIGVISSPPIERLLTHVDSTQVASWAIKVGGHRLYGLTIKNLNLTLVYDLDQNLWHQWTDSNEDYWPIVAHTFDGTNHVVQHETNGKLYLTDKGYAYPTDDGEIFPVDIYTPNFDGNTDRRKLLHAMFFNSDQKEGSRLLVRFSEDDYQTWSNFREVNLANKRPLLTHCGTFTKRAWHFRHYAKVFMRIRSVGLQLDLGSI